MVSNRSKQVRVSVSLTHVPARRLRAVPSRHLNLHALGIEPNPRGLGEDSIDYLLSLLSQWNLRESNRPQPLDSILVSLCLSNSLTPCQSHSSLVSFIFFCFLFWVLALFEYPLLDD